VVGACKETTVSKRSSGQQLINNRQHPDALHTYGGHTLCVRRSGE